jgi:hypothetical protein
MRGFSRLQPRGFRGWQATSREFHNEGNTSRPFAESLAMKHIMRRAFYVAGGLLCFYAAGRVFELALYYELLSSESIVARTLGFIFAPVFWISALIYDLGN